MDLRFLLVFQTLYVLIKILIFYGLYLHLLIKIILVILFLLYIFQKT
jgi:hypothetical protein